MDLEKQLSIINNSVFVINRVLFKSSEDGKAVLNG